MFTWAAAESTVWPIIPDFLLLPVSIVRRPRHIPLLATLLGSALGGMAWHVWASLSPTGVLSAVRKMPLVRPDQIQEIQARIRQSGSRALLAQPWSGIGLKVWAPVAATEGIPAGRALILFTVARAMRLGLVTGIGALLARAFKGRLEVLAAPLGVIYLALFFLLWWRIVTREYPNADS